MRALDKETAIARMNTFGRKNTPFLFIIDYTQEQSYVEALDEIDTSVCLYRFGEADIGTLLPRLQPITAVLSIS